jgi:ESX secretion-associated protein EspG
VPRFTLELSPAELDVVWRSQPFGELPLILDVPSPGATHAERAALEAKVWTGLVERELADDHGRPISRLADTLDVLARRRRSLELRTFGPGPLRAILAVRGRRAVLAVLDDRLRLATVSDTGLAGTLLSLLPDLPAGPGHPVTVPATALAAATQATTPARAWDMLTHHGVNRDEARILVTMATGSIRTGQIAAELRAVNARLARTPRVVAFHDTSGGRYQSVRNSSKGTEQLTVAPATPAALVRSATNLLTELNA